MTPANLLTTALVLVMLALMLWDFRDEANIHDEPPTG